MSSPTADTRFKKSAYGVLIRFRRNLDSAYKLEPDQEEMMVLGALRQHGDHLAVHNIEQKTIDAFKLVCWLGGSLLEAEKGNTDHCEAIIGAILKTLRQLLLYESDYWLPIPDDSMELLKSFLLQERSGNPKHGIWMNGLYIAFHCSLASWKHGKATRTHAM